MISSKKTFTTIDEYIRTFPTGVQPLLEQMRDTIREAAPEARETISYQIPTFTQHGNLVHFGGFKSHIGFYPTPSAIEAFKKELLPYEVAKGSIRFLLDKPLPLALIQKIVQYRVKENQERSKKK